MGRQGLVQRISPAMTHNQDPDFMRNVPTVARQVVFTFRKTIAQAAHQQIWKSHCAAATTSFYFITIEQNRPPTHLNPCIKKRCATRSYTNLYKEQEKKVF